MRKKIIEENAPQLDPPVNRRGNQHQNRGNQHDTQQAPRQGLRLGR